MEYEVAFELSKRGIGDTSFFMTGVLFILIGFVMIKLRHVHIFPKRKPLISNGVMGYLVLVFSTLWTVTGFVSNFSHITSLREDYTNGSFDVVEGLVEDFDPMPPEGHKRESFTVNGVKFEYSDYVITPGFNNAASKGGPIKEGLPVRISYIDGTIVKLEVDPSFKGKQII